MHISVHTCITHKILAVHKQSWKPCAQCVQKAGLSLNMLQSQTTQEENDHGRYMSIVKGEHASFLQRTLFHLIVLRTR